VNAKVIDFNLSGSNISIFTYKQLKITLFLAVPVKIMSRMMVYSFSVGMFL
jgi:hypothetical protein